MKRIYETELAEFCAQALKLQGVSEENARITAGILACTDAFGTHSHGTKNLRMYIEKMKAGALDPRAEPAVLKEGPAFAVMDAQDGLGMVASYRAMEKAMELAQKNGIGFVAVRNSCHFGAAGYYSNMAAQKGMIGIAMSNVDRNMAVPGGKGMTLGNNPFSFAVPAGKREPVFLDIALSATAALKINQAKLDNRPIPDTWLVDDKGLPTTDPHYYQNGGALQPMAAHKGYGLSVLVEVLSALLSGGSIVRDIPSWCFKLQEKNRVCHAFIAVDAGAMQPEEEFLARVDEYADYIKTSPKAEGTDEIFLPGEIEWKRRQKAASGGISLPDDVVESLERLANDAGLNINWLN